MRVIAITGAREPAFNAQSDTGKDAIAKALAYITSIENARVLVGGATGWDFAIMQACAGASVPWTLCLPTDTYASYYWRGNLDTFNSVAQLATKTVIVCKTHTPDYKAPSRDERENARLIHTNFIRNQYMIDYADEVVSWWKGGSRLSGGTSHALRYAEYKQLPMTHFGHQW